MAHSRPRVLHVDTATEWRGGQVQLLALVRGMRAQGWSTAVACPPDSPLWNALDFLGSDRVPIPAGTSARTVFALRAKDVDLVAAHTSHAHTAGTVGGRPLVVHRRVDFVPSGGWKYRQPDLYIAVSRAVEKILRQVGADDITVVYDGVDPLPEAAPAPDGPAVLAVGACVAHKGHAVLAKAAEEMSGLDIGVAGEGPLRYPGLRYLGQRPDVPNLLAGADVFVHPSLEEGLGQAVIEAMLAGVPVVVSDAGGLPEVVGDTGIVVPRGNPDALADGIRRALAGEGVNPAAARMRAIEMFSVKRMVEGTLAAYQTVWTRTRG